MNKQFEQIEKYIRSHCQADDYSLSISSHDSHETRFAQNGITQHIAGPGLEIGLEVAFGQQTGSCSVNQDDEATLAHLIKTAEDIARLNRPDPEYLPSVGAQTLPEVNNCDPATRDLEPAKMVEIVAQAIDKAGSLDPTVVAETLYANEWESPLSMGGKVAFAPGGQNIKAMSMLTQLQGGEYKRVYPADLADTEPVVPMVPWSKR